MKKLIISLISALVFSVFTGICAFAEDVYTHSAGTSSEIANAFRDANRLKGSHTVLLNDDIELNKNTPLIAGADVEITIIGNGHSLYLTESSYIDAIGGVINFGSEENTTALVISGEKKVRSGYPLVLAESGGVLNMYENTVIGNNRFNTNSQAVGVYYGTFNMYGGEITGIVNDSGAVYVTSSQMWITTPYAVFNMYGGKITDNTGTYDGGGVCVENVGAVFNMYGGEISENSARNGGGVSVSTYGRTQKGPTFNMYGGTISQNTVSGKGGGVYVSSRYSPVFNMQGGEITQNTSDGMGAGIYYDAYSKVTLSGSVTVQDNTANGAVNNLNILDTSHPVYVVGALEGSKIGVSDPVLWGDGLSDDDESAQSAPSLTIGYKEYNGTEPSAYFTSDHKSWGVGYSEDKNEVRLVRKEENNISFRTIVDSGFCSDMYKSEADENSTGAVAVSAIVDNFENVMDDIDEFGFTVVSNGDKNVVLGDDNYRAVMENKYGAFYAIFYNIPYADFDKEITVSPYVIDSKGAKVSGAPFSVVVENRTKWLGSVDTMKNNHSSPRINKGE